MRLKCFYIVAVAVILVIVCLLFVLPMLMFGSIFGTIFFAAKKGIKCTQERVKEGCEMKQDNAQYETKKVCKSEVIQKLMADLDKIYVSNKVSFANHPYSNPFVYDENLICGYNIANPCKSGYSLQGDVVKSCQLDKIE